MDYIAQIVPLVFLAVVIVIVLKRRSPAPEANMSGGVERNSNRSK